MIKNRPFNNYEYSNNILVHCETNNFEEKSQVGIQRRPYSHLLTDTREKGVLFINASSILTVYNMIFIIKRHPYADFDQIGL